MLILFPTVLLAVDRHISPSGTSLDDCSLLSPCSYVKYVSIRLPGDRAIAHSGTYDFIGLDRVEIVPFGNGPVSFSTPGGLVPLDQKLVFLAAQPSTADVRVRLKSGQRLQNVRWTYRKTDNSETMFCTVNKSTKVEVVK